MLTDLSHNYRIGDELGFQPSARGKELRTTFDVAMRFSRLLFAALAHKHL